MISTPVSIPGYQLCEQIYNGSRTLVYQALRTVDSFAVVIKVLQNHYPSFSELVQFRNQYTIVKNLKHPGIIQTYSLEPFKNGYALVMEDFGGISFQEYFVHNIVSLPEFLQIAISLCDVLEILYRHRIIHKDIKPANILINPNTKQVKLIDFSIASLLPKETQEIKSPNVLEGTLAYLAPEQTGRMNRGIDYRTDFYALGVTLFELLTGELPFPTEDAMELVHCHIAKKPPKLGNREQGTGKTEEIPPVLNDIVQKLMAKNAEDRYQSALGLKYDLQVCLNQLEETGKIEEFEIGTRDICDRFLIPEKLYGRENEVEQLITAFERVCDGNSDLMLVAGFSGIGKTAVVNEVHKPIVKQRGYFIKGKFDQFNRNIPLDAFVQALRDLIGQLLSESDAQLSRWKSKILQAVGEQGQVIIDVIPPLEKIIGKQPPVPELSGTAAQNRFNLLFQKFIQVFTTKEHPLVIFLDDLQWADSASLNLIKLLVGESPQGYLLMIGAYRDNEVFPAHPLMLTLDEVERNTGNIQKITLKPLSHVKINQLVADTLKSSEEIVFDLSELVYRKTQGNPFFATQFLKYLYQDNLITFNQSERCWQCDVTQVNQKSLTSDVVEFMVFQLRKLPESTQHVLKLAACIGNQFDLETLAIICEQSTVETAACLWNALEFGLILPQTDIYKFFVNSDNPNIDLQTEATVKYKFLHDRVQQAAYSLIPDKQKQTTHYHIGQLLLKQTSPEIIEERIFEIVSQLNYGVSLIRQQAERDELAQLNLIACRKAKISTAYQAGYEYARIGLSLLRDNGWEERSPQDIQFQSKFPSIDKEYEMILELHNLAAELASLCGDFAAMDKFVKTVIERSHSLIDKIHIYCLKIICDVSLNKLTEAIDTALQVLQLLGVNFPEKPTQEDVKQAVAEIDSLIGDREITDLVNLPVMVDKQKIATLQIANSVLAPAYISGSPLHPLLVALPVKLSILYGNIPASATAYVCYSIISSSIKQDVLTKVKFGQLALEVVTKLDARSDKPAVFSVGGLFLFHRTSHLKTTLPLLQEGYTTALEDGNLEYVGYAANHFCLNSFWCGKSLISLELETRNYCNALVEFSQLTAGNWCRIHWQSMLNLLGLTEHSTILDGEAIQEPEFVQRLLEINDLLGLYFFYLYKIMLCYLFDEIESAKMHVIEMRNYSLVGAGTIGEPTFYLYDSLIALVSLNQNSQDISEVFTQVEENQTKLQQEWANYAPMNHQHKVDLVEAEKYRVLGKNYEAADYYDKAISGAKSNEYIQEQALANELAAKFYLDWGKEKVAAGYMQEAYYCYAHWGAKAKTDDLEQRYPDLLHPILQVSTPIFTALETIASPHYSIHSSTTHRSSSTTSINQTLDFAAIIKASQTISRTIDLDELIQLLTRMMLENSGGDKCVLVFCEDKSWQVRAIATLDNVNLQSQPLEGNPSVPSKLIQYVKRTEEIILIDNLQTNLPVIGDYLSQHQPQSVLCLPILNQGQLIGVLYLENKSTSCVFTSDRILILDFLCTQAAISLENARLYVQQQEKNREIAAKEAEYRSIFESVSDGLLICDLDTGKLIACNPTYSQIYGYTETDFSYLIPADYIHSDYLYLFSEYLTTLKAGKEFYTQSVVGKRKDGSYFDIEVKAVPFIYKGKVHGLTILRDISEQKAAKKALEETNTLLNSLLQTIPDIFFAKDLEGRYIAVNTNMANYLGKSIPEIIGKNDTEIVPLEFAEPIMLKDREIITKGITETLEEIVPINGVTRTLLSVKTPLRDSQGNITGLIGLTRDITDRKQAEAAVMQKSQELETALQELQQAQLQMVQNEKMASLGNLVAGVAHEVNNPIGFLNGSIDNAKEYVQDLIEHLELYQQNYPEPAEEIQENQEDIDLEFLVEDLPKLLDAMTGANNRIKSISTSLRTFSRADTDHKVTANLHEGLDSTLLILKYRLKANENRPAIVINKEYGDIPTIECFPGQLNQVFMNILANAIDVFDEMAQNQTFAELEANPQQIMISTKLVEKQVYIRIRDNGKGMSEEVQTKIFDHLFTTKGVGKGTGLGLAIAKQIIEETHNGKLSCNSVIGEGTEFVIEIPV